MHQTKSLKFNAILNVIRTICNIIFPLITFPYASKILLPEGTGSVNFANSIVSYFAIISTLGIETYAIREASKLRDDKTQLSKFTKEILIINLCSTLIAYILLFISVTFLNQLQNYKLLIYICSSTLLLNTIGINWLYFALEEFRYTTIRAILFSVISIILLFIFVKTKEDYVKYASISVVSSAGSNLLNLFHSRKYINLFTKIKLEFKKHLKPIFILFITSVAINIFTVLDTSMLGFLTNSTEVGYYSAAAKIVRMIRDLFPAVFTVLFARLSYYSGKNDNKNIVNLSEKTFNFIFLFAPPMTIGLIILMPEIVQLLCGEAFFPAINTSRIMTPLLIISSYSGFLGGQIMIAMQKERTYMWCMISAAIVDIVLNFIFIPNYGAFGAAFATLLTEIYIFILYTILLKNFLKQLDIKKSIIQYFISTFVMGIAVFFESHLFNSDLLSLIIIPLSGIVIYAICLLIQKNPFFLSILQLLKGKIKKS